jgi:hypothetical protein
MKPMAIAMTLSMLLVAGVGIGLDAANEEQAGAAGSKPSEVVSLDADAQTITVKKLASGAPAPDPETLKVEGKALASLKDFKTGDKIVLTCKEGTGNAPAAGAEGVTPEAGSEAPASGAAPCLVTEIAKAPDKN